MDWNDSDRPSLLPLAAAVVEAKISPLAPFEPLEKQNSKGLMSLLNKDMDEDDAVIAGRLVMVLNERFRDKFSLIFIRDSADKFLSCFGCFCTILSINVLLLFSLVFAGTVDVVVEIVDAGVMTIGFSIIDESLLTFPPTFCF